MLFAIGVRDRELRIDTQAGLMNREQNGKRPARRGRQPRNRATAGGVTGGARATVAHPRYAGGPERHLVQLARLLGRHAARAWMAERGGTARCEASDES